MPSGAVRAMVVALAIAATPMAGPRAAAAARQTFLVPDGKPRPVPVMVSGKTRDYYAFGTHQPLALTVVGPTTLTLWVRPIFQPGMPETLAFGVRVEEGPRRLLERWTRTRRGEGAFVPAGSEMPGLSRKMKVKVPAGSHVLRITLLGSQAERAVARVSMPRKKPHRATVALAPLEASTPLTAVVGEKQVACYLVDGSRAVTVRVVGPTSLEILSRRLFDAATRGKRGYTLILELDGARLREVPLFTTRSTTVHYANRPEMVPGKERSILVKVPKGVHRLTVRVDGGVPPPAVSVRFTIPQRDLGHSAKQVR